MRIELHSAEEDPAGKSVWRYHVIPEDRTTWVVEICQERGKYYWTRVQNMRLLEERRATAYPSREKALDAAISWIEASRGDTKRERSRSN